MNTNTNYTNDKKHTDNWFACLNRLQQPHSVLIKPATLEVRHFLNLTSRTVLLFFLVLYVIVEQPAVLILWICSLLIPP